MKEKINNSSTKTALSIMDNHTIPTKMVIVLLFIVIVVTVLLTYIYTSSKLNSIPPKEGFPVSTQSGQVTLTIRSQPINEASGEVKLEILSKGGVEETN